MAIMNLTVGPLPPAVYWRRRALVAGVLLVLVLLLSYSCGGSSGSGANGQQRGNTAANGPDPAVSELRPQTGSPPSSDAPSVAPAPASSASVQNAVAPVSDFCADTEMQLTPTGQKIVGGSFPYQFTLRIKNISDRTCKRDVGADPQEMHVMQNGQTLWSSDSCQKVHGQPDIRTFPPGIEDTFTIGWDGTVGAACNNKQAAPVGTYQVVAKLDTKLSAPANFAVS
jgi:hypothetical protein